MTSFVLVVSMLLVLVAVGILVRAIIPLVVEVNRTVRAGAESGARIKGAVAGIREEEGRWPDAAVRSGSGMATGCGSAPRGGAAGA
jgi:hypothetical protein